MVATAQPHHRSTIRRWSSDALAKSNLEADSALGPLKTELFSRAQGVVLDIGAGDCVNRKYLSASANYLALDPSPNFSASNPLNTQILCSRAELIPLLDQSVDCVLSSRVLCSVSNLKASLAEIHRVLKPGGRLLFIEHVGAPRGTTLRLAQRVFRPVCRYFEEGCEPDRDIAVTLRASPLVFEELREFRLKLRAPLIQDWVAGSMVRPRNEGAI